MLRSTAMVGLGSGVASSDGFSRSTSERAEVVGGPGRFRPLERSFSAVAASVVVLSLATAACGTSSGAKTPTTTAVIAASCQHLADVLANGPDPDADPVGYALAQIKPLRAIHTSDKPLGAAIAGLASAYQTFYADNGTKAAALVAAAGARVDKFCPGATS